MNIKLILLIATSTLLLSACVIRPPHRGANVIVKVPVRTVLQLEQEHQGHGEIVIVNAQPVKKRQCWSHKNHWHCHR